MTDLKLPVDSSQMPSSPSRLSICALVKTEELAQNLGKVLPSDRYIYHQVQRAREFLTFVESNKEKVDCLLLENYGADLEPLQQLANLGILLPIVIIEYQEPATKGRSTNPEERAPSGSYSYRYHLGEVWLPSLKIGQLGIVIEQAIAKFLKLAPASNLPNPDISNEQSKQNFLMLQQRRLAEKLKERLGYLGIYYKRNPQDFYRHLPPPAKKAFLTEMSKEYREIMLNYFLFDYPLNQNIDRLVNQAFFADLSPSQILEIHMELMDQFSQQLKLEGRSEEILLDYRLALIDILAHLCEMYRRSIPREDLLFEIFASSD